jgi:hypothetical protein
MGTHVTHLYGYIYIITAYSYIRIYIFQLITKVYFYIRLYINTILYIETRIWFCSGLWNLQLAPCSTQPHIAQDEASSWRRSFYSHASSEGVESSGHIKRATTGCGTATEFFWSAPPALAGYTLPSSVQSLGGKRLSPHPGCMSDSSKVPRKVAAISPCVPRTAFMHARLSLFLVPLNSILYLLDVYSALFWFVRVGNALCEFRVI